MKCSAGWATIESATIRGYPDWPSEYSLSTLHSMRPEASPTPRRRRVPAMPPDERRAAIITATLPLLREHGLAVSTRQIAEAAGVAEGTIFGVFPDKKSLIQATMLSAFDPAPLERLLAECDASTDLRTRMHAIADAVTRRLVENPGLFIAMRRAGSAHREQGHHPPPDSFFAELNKSRQRMLNAITNAIEPDRDRLRLPPSVIATLLTAMLAAGAHGGGFGDSEPIDPHEIVTALLDGLLIKAEHRAEQQPEPWAEKMPADPSTFTGDSIPC